jgi:radical SAM-linked protein
VPLGGEGNAEEWLGAVQSALTPTAPASPAVQRVRVGYRKIGPARFIATRELGTIFLRATRRAGLPVAYSNGHHPLPRIGFGPALPVGFSSDDELVDLDLTTRLDPAAVLALLTTELPEGLEPFSASEIARGTPSIDQSVVALVYDVDLSTLDAPPSPDIVAAAVARFHASDTVLVRKRTPRGERMVDARGAVLALTQVEPLRLHLELVVGPDGTLKPGTLLGALLALPDDLVPLVRIHKRATRLREVEAALPREPLGAATPA